jgi:putative ATP-binding cassette transporter
MAKHIGEIWRLTRGYWGSSEKGRAWALLAAIVALTLGNVYVLVLLNEWNNRFYNALQEYDVSGFWHALGDFSLLAAAFIITAVYEQYLQQMLEINWRRWMTADYLATWLDGQTYYRLQLLDNSTDNPDQRISEDLQMFVSLTLRLALGFLKAGVTLVSFVAILWRLSGPLALPAGGGEIVIPGYMVWVALVYAAAGTWLTARIGRPLIGINFNQQRYEADFRFSLVRLRENSESIAFYKGEAQEEVNFAGRFAWVYANFRQLMRQQKRLTWLTSGYAQIAIIFPYLVAAPRYFSHQFQLGGLVQTASAFGRVQDALSFFVESYSLLAQWRAVVNRLTGFRGNMALVKTKPTVVVKQGPTGLLSVAGLSVGLPSGDRLLGNLALTLRAGDRLLVSGPSGSGKSTLLRTLAGIWPFGSGAIRIPAGHRLLFLPQKAYLPVGTLREAVLYPYGAGWADDEAIREVLTLCRLPEWAANLDRSENWAQIMSLGEQQRLAFARALLHRPDWLFLDEATAALDEPTEAALYELLRERLPAATIVSVGHRSTLARYHQRTLKLDGAGGWQLAG